ncbi:MAG: helicase-related protein, partial [Desulfosalsimonas sp.]
GIDRTLYKHLQDLSVGHLIVDRCDAANIKIFYKLCWGVCSRYITGIAKTCRREDGLFEMMKVFCGPVRYRLCSGPEPGRRFLEIRSAAGGPGPDTGEGDYVALLDGLCENHDRNRQVAADILAETAEKRRCLVVSARTGHLETISDILSEQLRRAEIVTGRTKPGGKKSAEQRFNSGQSLVLMTTTKTVGALEVDGADLVIVVAPFKYKDTAANIVHLLKSPGKIVEYSDRHPFFKASLKKRVNTYRELGVQVAQSV